MGVLSVGRLRPAPPSTLRQPLIRADEGLGTVSRIDQQRHRKNRGSRGGRPTGFDSERYKKRNTVERTINRLKGFRAVATRYEKRAYIYLGTVTLAALAIWLRT